MTSHSFRRPPQLLRSVPLRFPVLLLVALVALSGCQSASYPFADSLGTPVVVSAGAQTNIDSVTNFGDSITCGAGASIISKFGYATLLDDAIARPARNLCRPGDQAVDMNRLWVFPNTNPTLAGHELYTVLIGTNDSGNCGGSPACVGNWYQALQASLVWLALPSTDKTPAAASTTRTGTWTPDLTNGLATSTDGSSLTFSIGQAIANRTLFVAYRVFADAGRNPGSAALTIDGIPAATLSSAGPTGLPVLTANRTSDAIFVARGNLGTVGPHTVTLTATGGGLFSLQWLGVSSADYTNNPAAPHVVLGSITPTASPSLTAVTALYNVQLVALAQSLSGEGMRITLAPTASAIDPATDLSDTVHPNDSGHNKLGKAFAAVL